MINQLLHSLDTLKACHPGIQYTLRWVPGHRDHDGNKRADKEAKRAAQKDASPPDDLLRWLTRAPLPASLSKVRQKLNADFAKQARTEWTLSPCAPHAARIDPDLPSKKYLQLITPLPRRHASILMQLWTKHAPLNFHLHRIAKVDSPTCPGCEQARETVAHFIMDCPAFEEARAHMYFSIGLNAHSLQYLLSEPKAMRPLFCFIRDTCCFAAPYGDLTLPNP